MVGREMRCRATGATGVRVQHLGRGRSAERSEQRQKGTNVPGAKQKSRSVESLDTRVSMPASECFCLLLVEPPACQTRACLLLIFGQLPRSPSVRRPPAHPVTCRAVLAQRPPPTRKDDAIHVLQRGRAGKHKRPRPPSWGQNMPMTSCLRQGTPCLPEARGSCSWFADMQSHCKLHNDTTSDTLPNLPSLRRPFRNPIVTPVISLIVYLADPSLPCWSPPEPNFPFSLSAFVSNTCTPAPKPWRFAKSKSARLSHMPRAAPFQNAQTHCSDD